MKRIKYLPINFFKGVFFGVRVEGESAWPYLIPGKEYIASRFFSVKTGDFIVFRNPRNSEGIYVKRVIEKKGESYRAGSTVSWGSSSKDFGLIAKQHILGKLLFVG